jgi:hypothetical protein
MKADRLTSWEQGVSGNSTARKAQALARVLKHPRSAQYMRARKKQILERQDEGLAAPRGKVPLVWRRAAGI